MSLSKKMDPEELIKEIKRREELFSHYYDNYRKHYNFGNFSKASEFLWGAIHTLLYIIALLKNKPFYTHKKAILFATDLANETGKREIYEGAKFGEMLHSNFYHNFLDKAGLDLKIEKIELMINILINILREKKIALEQSI